MNLSIAQLKTIHNALETDNSIAIDDIATEMDMSTEEVMEHYHLAEMCVGLTDSQYDSVFSQLKLSKEYLELKKYVELLGETISDKQWSILADQARSLSNSEINSLSIDPDFSGMHYYLSEMKAELGIW